MNWFDKLTMCVLLSLALNATLLCYGFDILIVMMPRIWFGHGLELRWDGWSPVEQCYELNIKWIVNKDYLRTSTASENILKPRHKNCTWRCWEQSQCLAAAGKYFKTMIIDKLLVYNLTLKYSQNLHELGPKINWNLDIWDLLYLALLLII